MSEIDNARYIADHDYHIHSTVSLCCHDDSQTPEAILSYAKLNGFSSICLTNHFWDEAVESEIFLRPYFIAKECGCRFYLGSDSHKASALVGTKENFEHVIETLNLRESDKFKLKTT